MARKPMHLNLKEGQLAKDVGKKPGGHLTDADIAKEKAAGGTKKKRAVFAENVRSGKFGPHKAAAKRNARR